MSVAETHRGRGISKLLMATAFDNVKLPASHDHEPTNIFLSTSEFQTTAMRLYEKYGFKRFTGVEYTLLRGVTFTSYNYHMQLP